MESTTAVTPAYTDPHVTLYHADVIPFLSSGLIEPNTIAAVVTDPPYVVYNYIRDILETRSIDLAVDARWTANAFNWIGQWWWPLRDVLRTDATGWVFCNVHYVGFYLRWAALGEWPLRGIFRCPPDEYLLAFGSTPLLASEQALVREACALNRYGQNKPLALLAALIRCSTDGIVVDPFAGLGSTLAAARLLGRRSIGVEIRPELVARAGAALATRPMIEGDEVWRSATMIS